MPLGPCTLEIFNVVKSSHALHGLRHGDYVRYRQYCTRRLHRIRKVVGLTHGKGRFIKRQSSERTKICIQKAQGGTTVTLETAPVAARDGTATPATAAPEEDALLERPSLSRADLLGGKPGHFARTHVKKVVADAAKPNVTIVVDGAGGDVVADSSFEIGRAHV